MHLPNWEVWLTAHQNLMNPITSGPTHADKASNKRQYIGDQLVD